MGYLNSSMLRILHHHRLIKYNRASVTRMQIYQAKPVVKPVSPAHALNGFNAVVGYN